MVAAAQLLVTTKIEANAVVLAAEKEKTHNL